MILSISLLLTPAFADSNSWYCQRMKDHRRPACPSEFSFIKNSDCFWIDESLSDDSETRMVYLTFDAGYENGNVEKILDVLKEKDVPGAFFILINLVNKNGDLVKRMVDEGHLVCNHTAIHKDMSKITDEKVFGDELKKLSDAYEALTGSEIAPFYRAPEGRFSEQNLKFAENLGYSTVLWSFAYADWDNNSQMSPEAAQKKILDNVHNGAVLLLHPTSATNASILGNVIDALKEEGYSFGTLYDLRENCRAARNKQ